MEIKAYLNILIKRLWIVTLIPLLAAAAAFIVSFYVLEPVYESSMTLYVMNKVSDSRLKLAYDDILASQQLIKDCRELIKSKSMSKAAIEQLQITYLTPEDLAKKIIVNLKNDTRILEIKVRDANAVRAKEIVEKVSSLFVKRVQDLMLLEKVDVVDEAEIPVKPVEPKHLFNILVSLFTALILVVGTVFSLEHMDDTIKDLEDVEKYLGLKVIATIPLLKME